MEYVVLFTLLLAFFEIMITARNVDYTNLTSVFSLFATIILPVIIKNSVITNGDNDKSMEFDKTMNFKFEREKDVDSKKILKEVYDALL